MSARTAAYAPIDVHVTKAPEAWPATIPQLTAHEAERAFRRLYRYSIGRRYEGEIAITTGNRRALRMDWSKTTGHRAAHINPSQGWRDFAHDASHWFDHIVNGESKHGKHHARFEAKLIREIVSRGWLEGKLLAPEPALALVAIDPKGDARRARLVRIGELSTAWERKQSRAEKAIVKLERERRRIERALAM